MAHFPLFIDISHKKCLVVGGGDVALRKIETLLVFDAD
ncbi:MAG: NAD(P)-dependent oxidoreductase, partial [Bacillota bacterium]|nr:NAD(P)-dependent oxidoreductase [Bacillota bacterium]